MGMVFCWSQFFSKAMSEFSGSEIVFCLIVMYGDCTVDLWPVNDDFELTILSNVLAVSPLPNLLTLGSLIPPGFWWLL